MVDTAQHTVAVLPDQYLYNQDTVSKIMSSSWYRLDDDTYLYRLKAITPPQMIFSNACNQQEFSDALAAYMAGAYEKARDICACLKATYPSFLPMPRLLTGCWDVCGSVVCLKGGLPSLAVLVAYVRELHANPVLACHTLAA
eukprot:jgi/Picre1/31822/NNA_007171.t1